MTPEAGALRARGRCRPGAGTAAPGSGGPLVPERQRESGSGLGLVVTAVPAPSSWYFSSISRAQAQQLLLSPANAPGAFLIRPSESSHGDYSLSGTGRLLGPLSQHWGGARVTLALGWVLPRLCWPHVRPGHLVSARRLVCPPAGSLPRSPALILRPPRLTPPSPSLPSSAHSRTLGLIYMLSARPVPALGPSHCPSACSCPRSLLSHEAPRPGLSPARRRSWCFSAHLVRVLGGPGASCSRDTAFRCAHSPVRAQATVHHYRISTAADGLYLQKGQLFPSLQELLAYYKANWKLIRNPLLQPCVPQVGQPPATAPAQWPSTCPAV